jgi:hypothetical protein
LVRVPDAAQEQVAGHEQVAGQEAAPRVSAVPVGRAAAEPRPAPAEEVPGGRAPAEQVLGGRAPVGPGPREQEPGSWEPECPARVVPVRSAAAVALVVSVSVSLGGLAVSIPAPAELDWSGAPSARGEEPPQGWVLSPVSIRLAAPLRGSASQSSAGSSPAPRRGWGPFPAQCWPVCAPAFSAVGRPSAVCRRAQAKAWVQ